MGLPVRAAKAAILRGSVAGAAATAVLIGLGCQQTQPTQHGSGSPAVSLRPHAAAHRRFVGGHLRLGHLAALHGARTIPSVRQLDAAPGPAGSPA